MNSRRVKVKQLLEQNPALRESDIDLWWAYINAVTPQSLRFTAEWFLNADSQEAVARAARQIRSDFPHLAGTLKVRRGRAEEETVNRTFFGKVLNIINPTK